jgi:hypothetical protein
VQSRIQTVLIAAAFIAAVPASAQFGLPAQQPGLAHRIDLPGDAPVALVGDEWGGSGATIRGSAYQLDVRVSLSLRNASQRRIRGITMAVTAQEAAPGGKASISIPSLDVAPGETFPVRGDLHLLRPIANGSGPMVEVSLDGLLFDDLSFYGPDRLHSRRSMIVWEMEARRDRQYLRAVLEQGGRDALQKEMLTGMAREADRPQYGVQALKGHTADLAGEQDLKFAFLHFPDAPVEPMDGMAHIAGNEARAPKVVVHNRSTRAVKYLEIGWIVKDNQGHEFLAATVPAEMRMPSRSSSQILDDTSLRFDPRTNIQSMTGYVSHVEFTDGTVWIPSHAELDDPVLRRAVAPSAEEQRLVQIYRKRGVAAVMDELKRFQDKPTASAQ